MLLCDALTVVYSRELLVLVCELPDYQSKNGRIYAVSKNGTEVPLAIKGTNWFGMETGQAMPFGLWENNDNGTNVVSWTCVLRTSRFLY